MKTKTIKLSLSTENIERAVNELEEYKRELTRKTEIFRRKIADKISGYARSGFTGAVVDDIINGSTRYAEVSVLTSEKGNMSFIIADGEDAVWLEFGAGVYHNGSAGTSPHPKGSELGLTIGGYGKGHGKRQAWGFYEDGELLLTHGTPAVMPMYNAVRTVCADITEIAREVWS